jgi:xanthine dehydrogenase YagS FAD-binding subunit
MTPFAYERARNLDAAIAAAGHPGAKFIGGGTNLLDLMKMGVETPATLIDINHLPLSAIEDLPDGGLRIGAAARNSDAANHPSVRQRYPLLSQALLAGASGQLRNMATIGGNLLQRTRCYYFNDPAFAKCNKRAPGSGCSAIEGRNRIHAILGASPACIATHPSDMSVALAALDAVVHVRGSHGSRQIPFADFYTLPGEHPERDTTLGGGELITAVVLPQNALAQRSHYLKVRDRASYAFALVSVAGALEIDNAEVKSARIALGGVAHKPWRATAAEAYLAGKPFNEKNLRAAARLALQGASPHRDNAFKIELAQRAIVRAMQLAGGAA